MAAPVKGRLIKEYLRKCGYIETYLTVCGFSRCQFNKERLGRKSSIMQIYSLIFLSLSTLSVTYIFHYAKNHEGFFLLSDTLMAYALIIFYDVTMFEANFSNNGRIVELHNRHYEIDEYLDVDDTAYLRELEYRHCFVFASVCFVFAIFFTTALIYKFQSAPYTVFFASIFIVMSLAGVGCDYINYTRLHLFLVLRVRYLNVAMMKYSQTKLEYVNGSFVFKALLWNSKCDGRVSFQRKARPEDFSRIFRKIIDSYDCFKTCYSFQIVTKESQWYEIGTLSKRRKGRERCTCASQHSRAIRNGSHREVWAEFRPALVMAESVIRNLNTRQSQFLLYGMFKIDSSLSLRALAAILVIIMALLQRFVCVIVVTINSSTHVRTSSSNMLAKLVRSRLGQRVRSCIGPRAWLAGILDLVLVFDSAASSNLKLTCR
ncbi:hypothetical protein EVAR_23890_1 [Eumeta japonica]|uniref:Uncharacterized protein n=1 Tax=Eumeta variegata TaxID=151549 RepID=A0A4C1V5E5_EUMVA|nr:hypothetical protein EVAR_23890_1 [Eumeta japonica]